MIHRTSKTGNFTIADNGFSVDPNLDWDAKGMLIYLLTKPDKWRINKGNLIRVVHGAGEKRIESILKKLETARYLIRWQSRNSKGQIIYDCEILESFRQYEDVRNALIARHSGDKHFKITAPPLSQCGSNKNSKTQNDEKPLGVRRLSAQENEVEKSTALAKPTYAESSLGSGVPLVNTDKELKTELVKTEKSLSLLKVLSQENPEREREISLALKEQEPDAQATEPDEPEPKSNPVEKFQTVEGQSSAPPAALVENFSAWRCSSNGDDYEPEYCKYVLERMRKQWPDRTLADAIARIRNAEKDGREKQLEADYSDYLVQRDRQQTAAAEAKCQATALQPAPQDLSEDLALLDVCLMCLGWNKQQAIDHMVKHCGWPRRKDETYRDGRVFNMRVISDAEILQITETLEELCTLKTRPQTP